MKVEFVICDVCEEKLLITKEYKPKKMQVIFTTDQDEGRATKPYFSIGDLDLCKKCQEKALEGNYIYVTGAQGYNKYSFKN